MRIAALTVFAVLTVTLQGCSGSGSDSGAEPDAEQIAAHRAEVEAWRSKRLERLEAEEGWLSVVGLEWLEEGVNRCGASPDAEVELPAGKAPAELALMHHLGDRVELEVLAAGAGLEVDGEALDAGQRVPLASDAGGSPTLIDWGDLRFFLIDRGGRLALRIKDRKSAARLEFAGIEHFPVSWDWRLEARFEPYDPPRTLQVPNILGVVNEQPSHGAVVFEHGGEEHRLDVIGGAEESLFLVLGDTTNGDQTYGGGRFLYAPAPDASGGVVLDFNRAYNPPCVFTAFATCPLPPRQNKLPFEVLAGERHGGGHEA